MNNDNGNKGGRVVFRAFGLITQLGVSMFVCVLIGVKLGSLLDGWFDSSPGCLLVFSFLGAFASLKVMYDLVMKEYRK